MRALRADSCDAPCCGSQTSLSRCAPTNNTKTHMLVWRARDCSCRVGKPHCGSASRVRAKAAVLHCTERRNADIRRIGLI